MILFHLVQEGGDRFYRALLGQGLIGFEPFVNRRSEGVWFEVNAADFEAGWRDF